MSRTATRGPAGVEDQLRRVRTPAERAEAHHHRGHYRRAEALLRRALAPAAQARGGDALPVAALSNRLAVGTPLPILAVGPATGRGRRAPFPAVAVLSLPLPAR